MATTGASTSVRRWRARSERARVVSATRTSGSGVCHRAVHDGGGGAARGRVGQEVVAVEARARDGHEQLAGLQSARVDAHSGQAALRGGGLGRERTPGGRGDLGESEGEQGHVRRAHLLEPLTSRRPSTSRATCRSSKGSVRSRSTW